MPGTPPGVTALLTWMGRENMPKASSVKIMMGRDNPPVTVTSKIDPTWGKEI